MIGFVLNSILLGIGLAMDAFSVSIANGLNEPHMRRRRECLIAGTYGFFQFLMPVIGWFCVHALVQQFRVFERFIPWIALALLLWIGGKMILEAVRPDADAPPEEAGAPAAKTAGQTGAAAGAPALTMGVLLMQGIATSIDALSVGFAIAGYSAAAAFTAALIIAAVTFLICMGGLGAGKRLGMRLAGKAGILGGCILIFIGIEIFVRGVFL
ncbi:MAG: manganese efflux pump [Firmicutes bacterium]|nr:manganese efflux pump [Bacillota bacterium]